MTTACPDDETLARFVAGGLSDAGAVAAHVAGCEACGELVAALARTTRPVDDPDTPAGATHAPGLHPGDKVGRYEIEGLLGMGGMGVVYVARDPELGRRVAIKLLRGGAAGSRSGPNRARLVREAKTMAALSHPNVVTLYDVGERDGEIYLAMELVTGRTLRDFLREKPRGWEELVPLFVQAGRGLAAAHELGIVHRDFKPDNVFIGRDGRVRVGDFGLAHDGGGAAPESRVEIAADHPSDATVAGAIVGTLRYMAPEQLAGRRGDVRGDQFAFAVSLWEALYGAMPYAGATPRELAARYGSGKPPVPPAGRRVPLWLARLVARGVRIVPEERFPSMAALLAALAEDPLRRRRRRRFAIVGAGLLACTAVAYAVGQRGEPASPCAGGPAALERAYGAEARARLRARFAASDKAYVRAVGDAVVAALDAFGRDWLAVRAAACEATLVRGEQSPELMDLRMGCLGERLGEVGALATALAVAPDDELARAAQAVSGLEPLALCSDERALRARQSPPPAPGLRAAAETVRAEILGARIATSLGAYPRALPLAEQALADARHVGFGPVLAEAHHQLGLVQSELGKGAEASASLHAAAAAADASRHDELGARARVELVFTVGVREGKRAESDRIVPYAAASITRIGGSPRLESRLLLARAATLRVAERPAEALELSLAALALLEKQPAPDELALAQVENRIGNDLGDLGRYAESLPYYDRALATRERRLGAAHPLVALVLANRGGTLRNLGRYREAFADQERALAIREQVFGPEHPETAAALTNLSNTHEAVGHGTVALELRRRAAAIAARTLPRDHPYAVIMRMNLVLGLVSVGRDADAADACARDLPGERAERGERAMTGKLMASCSVALLRLGKEREAWALYREAEAQLAKSSVDDELMIVESVSAFADVLVERGKAREALAVLERTVAVRKAKLGAEHHLTAQALERLGEARLLVDGPAVARPMLEEAVRVLEKVPMAEGDLARARAALSRARGAE